MNDIDKIKAKIKKLLALSKSSNPNEAATALSMAQTLMAEYNIATSGFTTLDVGETAINVAARNIPPLYESLIIRKIASAFGCTHFYNELWNSCQWVFIGLKHRAEVASYIGDILLRKIKAARRDYLKTLKRVRLKYTKTKRADEYCYYWACAVTQKLPEFAGISSEEKNEIERYKQENHPGLIKFKPKSRDGTAKDRENGYAAGNTVQLQHGVGGQFQSPLYLEA